MKQVFINLLDNSLKYTRTRPRAVIEVGELDGDRERVFFIRDNGVGFDMKYAGKLLSFFSAATSPGRIRGNWCWFEYCPPDYSEA